MLQTIIAALAILLMQPLSKPKLLTYSAKLNMTNIPLNQTNLLNRLVKDYVLGEPTAASFANMPHAIDGYKTLMANKVFSQEKRNLLVNNLLNQYRQAGINLHDDDKVLVNIKNLAKPNTFTVTTGHQLVWAGGPLFVAYKILTGIKLALELQNQFPDKHFVPLFWLASEDHDFEEISELFLFNQTYKWQYQSNNQPVGTLTIKNLADILTEITPTLAKNTRGEWYAALLNKCYSTEKTLSQASIQWFHDIFQSYGLVVLEPNQRSFKQLFVENFQEDIFAAATGNAMQATNQQLEAAGYKPHLNHRVCNTFFIHPTHGRLLIKPHENTYQLGNSGIQYSSQELKDLLVQTPEAFSPNVALRPVYQETILPNLAYIGGPAEVAYWLQLKGVFEAYQVQMPTLVLRFMGLIVGPTLQQKIEKTGLALQDFMSDEAYLKQQVLAIDQSARLNQMMQQVLANMQELLNAGKDLDSNLGKELLAAKLSLKDFFDVKRKEIAKLLVQKKEAEIAKALKLRQRIYPRGTFQERIETLMQHECQNNTNLSENLLQQISVWQQNYLGIIEV
jgi:bacillithiol biosynthesis cysteine-adding enzyme BshC